MKKKKAERKKPLLTTEKYSYLAFLVLFAVALLAYSNSFRVPFHFDDEKMILRNSAVADLATYNQIGYWMNINNRPFSFFTFTLNEKAGGFNPWGFHLVNFLIHLMGSFVAYLLAWKLFQHAFQEKETLARSHLKALFTAIIFLAHPLQTMAVTYIVQRMTSMAGLFFLLSVYLYVSGRIKFVKEGYSKKSLALLVLSGLSGLLAVLSKQTAATLPAVLLLTELFFIRKENGTAFRKYLVSGAVFLFVAFIAIAAAGYLPSETEKISRTHYLLSQFNAFLHYGRLLLVPLGQNVDYHMPVSLSFGPREAAGLFVIMVFLTLAVWLYKKDRILSFAILWFFLGMAVTSSIIPIRDLVMEHRLYISMFGFGLFLTEGLDRLLTGKRTFYFITGMTVICLLFAILTKQRNQVWASEVSLWTDSLKKQPDNPRAIGNLGYAYVKQEEYEKALKCYNRALDLDSTEYNLLLNRGIAYFDLGEYRLAIDNFNHYIAHEKRYDTPYFFRGVSYAYLEEYDRALEDLDQAIMINPDFAGSYKNRGIVYQRLEKYPAALKDFERSIDLDPSQKALLVNRSAVYYMTGKYDKALQDILEAKRNGIKTDPNYIRDLENLVKLNEIKPNTH